MGATTASASFMILLVVLSTTIVRHVNSEEQCHVFETNAIESSTEIYISSQNIPVLHAKCLQGFNKVVKLHLKNCKIQEIESDALRVMEKLQDVDLSHNLLMNLPENLFEYNKQLKRVILKNNKFTSVPYIAVPLNKLDLSRNTISSFNSTRSLDVSNLDLSYNLLESLLPQDMALMNKVVAINLNNNRWKCGSQFDEVLCWSLNKINPSSLIRCFTRKGKLLTYTIYDRQGFCEVNTQNAIEQSHISSTELPITGNSLLPKMIQSMIPEDGESITETFSRLIPEHLTSLQDDDATSENSKRPISDQLTNVQYDYTTSETTKRPISDQLASLQVNDATSEAPFGEVTSKRSTKAEDIVPVLDEALLKTLNKPNSDQMIPRQENLIEENDKNSKSEQLEMYEKDDIILRSTGSISNYEKQNIASEAEIYLKIWVAIAYIGWLFAGIAVTVLIYTCIFVYYKKPYRRINTVMD